MTGMSSDQPGPRADSDSRSSVYHRPGADPAMAQGRRNGPGTAALVIGVVALVLAILVLFAPLAALLAIVALVLGAVGIARGNKGVASNRGQALAGLVTGVIALVISIILMVSVGTFFARHARDVERFARCLDRATGAQERDACAVRFGRDIER